MPKKELFEEIIDCMQRESENHLSTGVAATVLNEFFTDNLKPTPAPQAVPQAAPQSVAAVAPSGDTVGMTLEELEKHVRECRQCVLCEKRINVVFGEGNPNADLMFIGEGPGYDEDRQARPFVGAAGQLLTKMINAMQFTREEVYIANIVKCRPPGNRNPKPEEAAACLPYLHQQIELIQPKAIVVLGAVPLQFLLNKRGIMRLRGQWDEFKGIKVMPTFHPAYLLRQASAKKEAWSDLQQVMALFGKTRHRK